MTYYLIIGSAYSVTWMQHHMADALIEADNELMDFEVREKTRVEKLVSPMLTILLFSIVAVMWPVRLYHDLKE